MDGTLQRLSLAGVCALLAVHAPARSQPAATAPPKEALPAVVITGLRASVESALQIKRDKMEIVDAVVADDIGKLPDLSVTDALQRVTGVQIARDRGEGANVTIRGLTQMETLLNGREVFTAGTGRNLDFADIPSEMVAGIDVVKTSSAEHIEGGVGGLIDLRTRRPFDLPTRETVISARLIHGDLVKSGKPQLSLLASRRWTTRSAGEFGLLVNLTHQQRAWREDLKGTGNPVSRADLVPGQTVIAPSATSETVSLGERRRSAGSIVLQWRPSPSLEWYAEASHAELRTIQDSHQINVSASPTFVPGSVTLFPGTNDLMRVTWTDAPVSILSFARDTVDRTRQLALGGSWSGERLHLKADLSHTKSFNNLFFSGPFLAGTAANFTHDLSTSVPGTSVSGTNLLDPANLRYTGIAYRARPFDGDLSALRFDAEYALDGGFVQTLLAGVRYARRGASDAPGLVFADAAVTGLSAADRPGFVMPDPYGFMPGLDTTSLHDFLVGNLGLARDPAALRDAFGITAPIPAAGSPLGLWDIAEQTESAYVAAGFKTAGLPLDGKLGLRVVRTHESVSGNQSAPASGSVLPIQIDSTYTDWLPSLSLRYAQGDGLVWRAAASKTITRPDFNQLSPSLTLVPNPINPLLNQGSAGNPALKPIRADNVDLAVEKYFSRTTAVHATAFWKKVDGFVTTVSSPEVHDGAVYQVSRPQNSAVAHLRGVELGYQQFYDALPGAWRGLGLQANYTYIDSRNPTGAAGATMPLQNLSRQSVNLIGMYEHRNVSARVATNWRDRFLSGVTNVVGIGTLPIYTAGYAWVDASLRYRFSDKVSLALEGTNLLRTLRRAYYGVPTHPQGAWLNDRQLGLALTVRFE